MILWLGSICLYYLYSLMFTLQRLDCFLLSLKVGAIFCSSCRLKYKNNNCLVFIGWMDRSVEELTVHVFSTKWRFQHKLSSVLRVMKRKLTTSRGHVHIVLLCFCHFNLQWKYTFPEIEPKRKSEWHHILFEFVDEIGAYSITCNCFRQEHWLRWVFKMVKDFPLSCLTIFNSISSRP